ncbi:MAG: sulfatase-like hydrolase/transferase [Rikenellaceae bacterium]
MNPKFSTVLTAITATTILPTTVAIAADKTDTKRPNIIILQADDMGYDDMSLQGNQCVYTPNLDSMAQYAVRFDNFYVHSVSAPTRASLITGRHFLRTGISGVHAGRDFLNLDEVTIAEAFKQAGYTTGMWGKWHSGKTSGYYPWQRGFDEAFMADLYKYRNNKGLLNGKEHSTEGWVDAVIADMAIDFIKENKDEPFFAYIPFLSPHGIWDAPEEYVEQKMAQGQDRNFATLNSMIDHLDVQIGKVLSAVEKEGLLDNTIIVFLSDNGPIHSVGTNIKLTSEEWAQRNPSQYRGNKGQNFDNGIHSPLFVYWKGHFENATNSSLVAVYDIFPTLCDVANVDIPKEAKKMDGISFKKVLQNPTITDKDRTIYISQWTPFFKYHDTNNKNQALPLTVERRKSIDPEMQMIGLHKGDYKVLFNQWQEDSLALWNLKDDYKESNNLYANGTDEDRKLTLKYRKEVMKWYQGILDSKESYQMPTFQLGYGDDTKTQIMCYAPYVLSEGLINDNLALVGFDKAGEHSEYKVNVISEGQYSIALKASNEFKGKALLHDKNSKKPHKYMKFN